MLNMPAIQTRPTASASGGTPLSIEFGERTGGRSSLSVRMDSLIGLLDAASQRDDPNRLRRSGGTRILRVTTPSFVDDWRHNVRKLAMLARLQHGWDRDDSQSMDRGAEANFLDWLATVRPDRMVDAEPMLTDEGHIRLEWRRDGYVHIAEIGARSLYLALLAPNRVDDDAVELDNFDRVALDRFFAGGTIR